MFSLSELGIKKNWTYEIIITCYNGDIPHAAPFGMKSPDMEIIQFELYKSSNTLSYIMDKKEFVINFIADTTYFFNSLYDWNKLPFGEAEDIKAPKIIDCSAYIEAKSSKSIEKISSYLINAEIINISV